MTEEERDRLSDENADKLRYLMRDTLGIVDPNRHIRLEFYDKCRVAIVEAWPVGIDKRRADKLAQDAGLTVIPSAIVGPYGSVYRIEP